MDGREFDETTSIRAGGGGGETVFLVVVPSTSRCLRCGRFASTGRSLVGRANPLLCLAGQLDGTRGLFQLPHAIVKLSVKSRVPRRSQLI